jgi:hypothetical protein
MALQGIATLAVYAFAVLAGLGRLSFWWVLIPTFVAASLMVSNRYYETVRRANEAGHLSVMPKLIGATGLGYLVTAGIVYGLTRLVT